MTRFSRFILWWRGTADERTWLVAADAPAPVQVTHADMNNAYQLGFQNGSAAGEYRGRQHVIQEIEIALAAKGKVFGEAELEDVQAAKMRILH